MARERPLQARDSQVTASKETVLHCKELDAASNLNELEVDSSPRTSRKENIPADTLMSVS